MGLRDELISIEVAEAERAAESVFDRSRSIPDALAESSRVLERDYEALLDIIVKYVRDTAEIDGMKPGDVLDRHKDFIVGMATGIIIIKEIAENRDMPDLGTPDA